MPNARIMRSHRMRPHQVRLDFKSGDGSFTLVKCNCRGDEPLGEITTGSGDWKPIYNNPQNHDNSRVPFNPNDKPATEVYFVD